MSVYVPAIIWVISSIVCLHLVKKRGLQPSVVMKIVGVVLGPLAIRLGFLIKAKDLKGLN